MLGVSLDERFDESGFPHTWRTDNGDDGGRRFGWEAIDKGNMEALLFDLVFPLDEETMRGFVGQSTS